MRYFLILTFVGLMTSSRGAAGGASETRLITGADHPKQMTVAQGARSCKAVSSCREAVEMWCGGYHRADGDHDGIPCENVCSSLSQVEKLKQEIGC